MTPMLWQQFHHPDVRALAWARFSAPLVSGLDGQLPSSQASDLAFLNALDVQPESLNQHLVNCNSHRLGYYFEALWSYYFQWHPDYQLLIRNRQSYLLFEACQPREIDHQWFMIARKLAITEGTVKVHVKRLLNKLHMRSRVKAAVWMTKQQMPTRASSI